MTFASRLHDRDRPEQYANREAYDNYLINNPRNESRFVFPLDEGEWQDAEDSEIVVEGASEIVVRGQALPLPAPDEYADHGIELEQLPR